MVSDRMAMEIAEWQESEVGRNEGSVCKSQVRAAIDLVAGWEILELSKLVAAGLAVTKM